MSAPSGKSKSNKRKGKRQRKREMDPIKLVMERGLNQEQRPTTITDEDGNEQEAVEVKLRPRGVVLLPMQTLVLANYINALNQRIQTLEGVIDMMQGEDDEESDDS